MTPPGPTAFVRAWAQALHATRYVGMTLEERHELVTRLAGRLAVGLVTEPFNPAIGYWVGVDLVAAEYAVPESLGATVRILNSRLLTDLGLTGETTRARLGELVAALATGFARASRDATPEAQDSVRLAAFSAREQAERKLHEAEAEFRYRALHDTLTGLPNRLLFQQRLYELLAEPAPGALVGVCSVDLDGFQRVNDSLGPPIGDRLLIAVADRLQKLARDGEHLLARLDGDEFALLVASAAGVDGAAKLADRVVAVLAEPFHIDGHLLPVSASTGVVETPAAGADATELIRAADVALRWAKAAGGGRWMRYETGRSARDVRRYRLSAEMPAALERGEFTLAYQPLVNLADGALVGYEALARWRHPRRGEIGAGQFIALAEDTGLIVPLGLRLLEEACRFAVSLGGPGGRTGPAASATHDPNRPFMSVNLSVRQIHHPGLVATVAEVLDRTGLPAGSLQLEITESAVIDSDRETLETLQGLADLGVRLVIDDFGTGYSNLANLHVLPVHGLKLAAGFVGSTGRHQPDRREDFLSAVVALGRTLGLTVTGEGIESADQAELLRRIGCELGQGWYFGRPHGNGDFHGRRDGGPTRQ
jgi:diguanylate cyclase (GGDEF)-like protein